MRLITILSILAVEFLVTSSAYGLTTPHFLPLTEIPDLPIEKQQEIAPIQRAVFDIKCTATFISNTGHFITADHCIKKCHESAYERADGSFDSEGYDGAAQYRGYRDGVEYFTFRRLDVSRLKKDFTCDVEVHGVTKKARVLATGKGLLYPYSQHHFKSQKLKTQYKDLLDRGVFDASDFAILQLEDKPNTHCVPLGKREPKPDEILRSIGYPCVGTQSHPENSHQCKIPLYSEGVLAGSSFFPAKSSVMFPSAANSFWSNLDAESGSSGSSVIGEDGVILGIMSQLQSSSAQGPTVNLVKFSGTKEIQEAIRTQITEPIVCDQ